MTNKPYSNKKTNKIDRRSDPKIIREIQGLAKLPPHSREVEAAVLGAMMIQKDLNYIVFQIITDISVFYDDRNVKIYNAMLTLFDKNEPIDMITVSSQLRDNGELDLTGGLPYLVELTSGVSSASNVEYHCRILLQYFLKRCQLEMAAFVEANSYEDYTDPFELTLKISEMIDKMIGLTTNSKSASTQKDILPNVVQEILDARNKGGLTGVPSGYKEIDSKLGGWNKGDLIIVAGRPGMGKTEFVINTAANAVNDFDIPVAIFSLEMKKEQIVKRLVSKETGMPKDDVSRGTVDDEWLSSLLNNPRLNNPKLHIEDNSAMTIMEFKAKAIKLVRRYNVGMIIIDYLQLMSSGGNSGNREQEISEISRSLKIVAKTLDVPIIALSQLSRDVEKRGGDKRPQLSDLRESGAIEQDADMVIFLYRPEYYEIEQDENGNSTKNQLYLIIGKYRHGHRGDILLHGDFTCCRINDWDKSPDVIAKEASLYIPKEINGLKNFYEKEESGEPDLFDKF